MSALPPLAFASATAARNVQSPAPAVASHTPSPGAWSGASTVEFTTNFGPGNWHPTSSPPANRTTAPTPTDAQRFRLSTPHPQLVPASLSTLVGTLPRPGSGRRRFEPSLFGQLVVAHRLALEVVEE